MIFIVDDDKQVLKGFQILLKSAGMESIVFSKTEVFLEYWDQNENDIIILDIHMEGMDGCDVMEYLMEKDLHPRVIIITAYEEKKSREVSERFGALAYFTKPVDSKILLDTLSIHTNTSGFKY